MQVYTLLEQLFNLHFEQQAALFSSAEVFFFTASTILAIITLLCAMLGAMRSLSPQSKIRMIVIALNVLVLDGLPCVRAYQFIPFTFSVAIIGTILGFLLALMLYYAISNGKGSASFFAFIAAWFGGCLGLSLWSVGFMFMLVLIGKFICPFILLGYLLCLFFSSSGEKEKNTGVEQSLSKRKDSILPKKEPEPKKEEPEPKKEETKPEIVIERRVREEPEPRKEEPTMEEKAESRAVVALRLQGALKKQDFFADTEKPKQHILAGAVVKKLCGGEGYPPIVGVLQASAMGKTWLLRNNLSGEWTLLRNGEPVALLAHLASDDTLTLQKDGEVQAELRVRLRIMLKTKAKNG